MTTPSPDHTPYRRRTFVLAYAMLVFAVAAAQYTADEWTWFGFAATAVIFAAIVCAMHVHNFLLRRDLNRRTR